MFLLKLVFSYIVRIQFVVFSKSKMRGRLTTFNVELMEETQKLIGQLILGRYLVRKALGKGAFGAVYEAEDIQTQEIVALKFEINTTSPQLPNEYKMYKQLNGMSGIPNTYGLYDYGKNKVLAMENMGPSLENLFRRCGKKFSLKTTLMIADQILRLIEYVHLSGILHRDIKPQNFLVGRGAQHNRIYLIDFGVSTNFIDSRTGEHTIFTSNNGMVGTAYYVSINTHLGDTQSRRDDLESIAYMLIRFLQGTLPWQSFKTKNKDERNEKIAQHKIQTTPDILCTGLNKEFKKFIEIIRRLRFDETPRYNWYRQMFTNLFIKNGFVYDGLFDWDEEASIHRPLPSVYLYHSAARYQRANERQIRIRKDKINLPRHRKMFIFGWRGV